MARNWFILKGQERQGPYSWEQLNDKAANGELLKNNYLWAEGMEDWTEAKNVADLFSDAPPLPDQPAVKKRSGKKLALIIGGSLLALFVVIIVVAVFAARAALVNSVVYEEAVNELHASSEAAEVLGSPIEVGSGVFGSITLSNGGGDAELDIPVSGPQGSGDLRVEGVLSDGQWHLTQLQLATEDGQRLDLLAVKETGEGDLDMLHYSSSKYGFEIKYPADWLVEERDDGSTFNVLFISPARGDGMYYGVLINPILIIDGDSALSSLDTWYNVVAGDVQELGGSEISSERDLDMLIGEETYNSFSYSAIVTVDGNDEFQSTIGIERDDQYLYDIFYWQSATAPQSDIVKYRDTIFDSFRFIPMEE